MMDQDKLWKHLQDRQVGHYFEGAPLRGAFIAKKARSLLRGGPSPQVLNVGIGTAWMERHLQQFGWGVASLDPDAAAIERAVVEGIDARAGYMEQMPFQERSFDAVFALEVLEHLSDEQLQKGLDEVHRVLKPGGYFLGTVPYAENLDAATVLCPHCDSTFHHVGHQQSFDISKLSACLQSRNLKTRKVARTAFVRFAGRGLAGCAKSLIRLALAKSGHAIAGPRLYFIASR